MSLHFLCGPTDSRFVTQSLQPFCDSGHCLPFGASPGEGVPLTLGPADDWQSFSDRFPDNFTPDVLLLCGDYCCIPTWLWQAPIPLIALAPEWHLQWHSYREMLPGCDRILTDQQGVEVMHQVGLTQARQCCLFGLGTDGQRGTTSDSSSEQERDIDVLLAGNLNPAVQRQRLPWMERLVALRERCNVQIVSGVFGEEYQKLLQRAKIVFNDSTRGEANQRVFEAIAAGALLFQEERNREVPILLKEGEECVFYREDNLEQLLEQYLSDDALRETITRNATERLEGFTFASFLGQALTEIEGELEQLQELAQRRSPVPESRSLLLRGWQKLSAKRGDDLTLEADLTLAAEDPQGASLALSLLGCVQGSGPLRREPLSAEQTRDLARHFQKALQIDGTNVMAALNLVEALVALGQDQLALEGALRTLATLDEGKESTDCLDLPRFPVVFDSFRVEWERAAWTNCSDRESEIQAKKALLRWRLHHLLGDLTGVSAHHYEAVLARPDLAVTRASLGCSLAMEGYVRLAQAHLELAVKSNPLDRTAARALFQVLLESGNEMGARRFAQSQRLLQQSASRLIAPEEWALSAPPVGDELASIVILCCNQVDVTRQCLESIRKHTRSPYELILINNGSTDETAQVLEDLKRQPGPARVVIHTNVANVGYPKGCNQGLSLARGRYRVLLNNDVIVTPGWLEGLIRWSLFQWPSVGMVGPRSNGAPPPQLVPEYPGPELLDDFAQKWSQDNAGQALQVPRLTGFCLLIREEVLQATGPLEESFGLGFFEDDDLCFRASDAGFTLLVAQDVFVHHYGSQTFQALGLDVQQQLRETFARFQQKWGTQRTQGYQLPGLPAQTMERPARAQRVQQRTAQELWPDTDGKKVSLCMIVKNEESNLEDCLSSVKDLVQEMVVVDTGSEDRTVEIAEAMGANVFHFPWVDSFAAARNVSLEHATGDWIFWMDADDRLDEENRSKLKRLLATLGNDNACYNVKCECLPDPVTKTTTRVDHIRLFRNHPKIRWQYRVHEQILPAVRSLNGQVRFSDVVVHHTGYQDPALRKRKLQRDLRLLDLDRKDHPNDPFILFNLGSILLEQGRPEQALEPLQRSLAASNKQDSIVRKLHAMITGALSAQGRKSEALAACRQGRGDYPQDVELLYKEGKLLWELDRLPEAEATFRKILESPPEAAHFASVDVGIRGYKSRHYLALISRKQQKLEQAKELWKLTVQEQPDFLSGWMGLGEIALQEGDQPTLEEVAQKVEAFSAVEAEVLRIRWLLQNQEYVPARQRAEKATQDYPDQIAPREVLSHVLLKQGQDWNAAETALREVLRLDPHHSEAIRNLHVLQQRQPGG